MATPKEILTIRAPRELAERVRAIAAAEHETHATILRRLLRQALSDVERRSAEGATR